jgi:DNA polymerase-3 subunit beta
MNVTVQKEFSKAVALVQRTIDTKTKPLPILSHFLVEGSAAQQVIVTGTDLATSIRLTLPAEVATPGVVALPGHKLNEIMHALPSTAKVTLAVAKDDTVELTCERSQFRLRGAKPEDFPQFPQLPEAEWLTLPATAFADLVSRTEFAVGSDASRFALTGISFRSTAEDLKVAATNGHRLALVSFPHANGQQSVNVIVPPKPLSMAARLGVELGGDLHLGFSPNQEHLVVQREGFIIASRLIDAGFPNVEQVVPASREHLIEIARETLRNGLRRIAPILAESQDVKLTPGAGTLTLSGRNPDLGDGREDLDCTCSGQPPAFSVQARYLLDYLDRVAVETIRLYVTSPLDPILVQPVNDDHYTYIVMPIRGE